MIEVMIHSDHWTCKREARNLDIDKAAEIEMNALKRAGWHVYGCRPTKQGRIIYAELYTESMEEAIAVTIEPHEIPVKWAFWKKVEKKMKKVAKIFGKN